MGNLRQEEGKGTYLSLAFPFLHLQAPQPLPPPAGRATQFKKAANASLVVDQKGSLQSEQCSQALSHKQAGKYPNPNPNADTFLEGYSVTIEFALPSAYPFSHILLLFSFKEFQKFTMVPGSLGSLWLSPSARSSFPCPRRTGRSWEVFKTWQSLLLGM